MPIISKANGKASGTASAAQKKNMLSPPPNITGKANGKIQGKAALLNMREYISAVAALMHYLRQMSTKVAIIHIFTLEINDNMSWSVGPLYLLYCHATNLDGTVKMSAKSA